jgi:Uma2 family endonuclease
MAIESDARRAPTKYKPPLVSWEDFLAWLREDVQAEWVDGEIVEMAPANLEHQDLGGFLHVLLRIFVERLRLGRVYQAPFLMRLSFRPSGREPDLMFIANEHLERLTPTYLDGPADLVIEVVSPESTVRDRRDKLQEYEAAKIPEYWLLDQPRREALFYVLDAEDRYQRVPIGEDGIYTSTVLKGFRLRVEWLWRSPLPTFDEALADLPF